MDSLHRIYSEVPSTNCKGLCVQACGPVMGSSAEVERIMERCGTFPLPLTDGSLTCDKLDGGRCSIYADRPLVCRLYGATRKLACRHGCSPTGGFMPERSARKLLQRADRIKPSDHLSAIAATQAIASTIEERVDAKLHTSVRDQLLGLVGALPPTPHS